MKKFYPLFLLPLAHICQIHGAEPGMLIWSTDWERQPGYETGFKTGQEWDEGTFSATSQSENHGITYVESFTTNTPLVEAWTITPNNLIPSSIRSNFEGNYSYQGWVEGNGQPAPKKPRAYPTLNALVLTPIVMKWKGYLEWDATPEYIDVNVANPWAHFMSATFDGKWEANTMPNLTVAKFDTEYELAGGKAVSRQRFATDQQIAYVNKEMHDMCVYLEWTGDDEVVGYWWKDGILMERIVLKHEKIKFSGGQIHGFHWGVYTDPSTHKMMMYEGDIEIWKLHNKLNDFSQVPEPVAVPEPVLPAGVYKQPAQHDNYVYAGTSDEFGHSEKLELSNQVGREIYMKFDIPNVELIESAVLRLYCYDFLHNVDVTHRLYEIQDDEWTEYGFTRGMRGSRPPNTDSEKV